MLLTMERTLTNTTRLGDLGGRKLPSTAALSKDLSVMMEMSYPHAAQEGSH